MEFYTLESTLNAFINDCGMNGKNKKRMDLKDQGGLQKRGPTPPQQLFLPFLVVLCLIQRMIFNKRNLKRIWHCS